MSTGTKCTLVVDGARFSDGSPGDPDTAALTGLAVVWGRDTTVDQPPPATCSFSVVGTATGIIQTGLSVAVEAVSTLYPDASVSTFLDPGFEADPLALADVFNAEAEADPLADSGVRSLRINPLDPARRWTVILPPAPTVPNGTDPSAWDAIPTTSTAQTWQVGARVKGPPGLVLDVSAVLFSGPWNNAVQVIEAPVSFVLTGDWQTVTFAYYVEWTAPAWLGLQMTAYPTGPTWDDLDPAETWDDLDPTQTWREYAAVRVDNVAVLAPDVGTERTVLVFAGRVTSMAAEWDDSLDATRLDVVASDFTADLNNCDVGDEPWPVEPMGDRFARILALADLAVTAEIGEALAPIPVSYRDVDRQPAAGLLQSLAASVDGVLWAAAHLTTGAYLKVEDTADRQSLFVLVEIDGVVVVVSAGSGTVISACDVARDPITFQQDVNDITTRAAVTWKEQTTDDDGIPQPTDRTVTVIDPELETRYGVRRISVATELVTEDDATDVAQRLLDRLTIADWRASGVHIDDDDLDDPGLLLDLLDGTTRIGQAIRLTDLPPWSPVGAELPLYVEGGTCQFDDGRWLVDLNVSQAHGQGESAAWNELNPAWTWAQFDPSLSWADLYGVGGPLRYRHRINQLERV
jgi:hypothetical protein